jgi:hydroxypyruvate isomerase
MGKYLDIDDCCAQSPVAKAQLEALRHEINTYPTRKDFHQMLQKCDDEINALRPAVRNMARLLQIAAFPRRGKSGEEHIDLDYLAELIQKDYTSEALESMVNWKLPK